MKKDFITATPDTGGGNGTINVTASKTLEMPEVQLFL